MGRGIHYNRTQTRHYTNEYHRIAARAFRHLLTSQVGRYKINGLDRSDAHCNFTLKDADRGRVMVFTFDNREISIQLRQDNQSASNKVYLVCPYCTHSRQHLYALSDTYACRVCAGLHYSSQSEREPDRLARRIRKLRRQLWGNDCIDADNLLESCCWWPKPKRMRSVTFEKKRTEIEALERRNLYFMELFFETHLGINSEYMDLI